MECGHHAPRALPKKGVWNSMDRVCDGQNDNTQSPDTFFGQSPLRVMNLRRRTPCGRNELLESMGQLALLFECYDAERRDARSHAERGNEKQPTHFGDVEQALVEPARSAG